MIWFINYHLVKKIVCQKVIEKKVLLKWLPPVDHTHYFCRQIT